MVIKRLLYKLTLDKNLTFKGELRTGGKLSEANSFGLWQLQVEPKKKKNMLFTEKSIYISNVSNIARVYP